MKPRQHGAARSMLAGVLAVLVASGCPDPDEEPALRAHDVDAPAQQRSDLRVHRALLAEAARAELDAGGLLVDFGSPEQHKYTRGGWRTGWGPLQVAADGTSYAPLTEQRAEVSAVLRAHPREIVVRARSLIAGQHVTVRTNGTDLGSRPLGTSWSIIRVSAVDLDLSQPIALELEFEQRGPDGPLADVDWLWFRSSDRKKPPRLGSRVEPVQLGSRTRLALLAPTERSYSFYLQPPALGRLVFGYGSEGEVEFEVRVEVEDGELQELFRATAEADRWTSAEIDLSGFAGRAIRLDLTTHGDGRGTGWATPAIAVPAERAPARRVDGGAQRPKNALVVVMDTTRADAFSTVDPHTEVVTPSYDAMAARSTVFAKAYNNECWTVPSTATILSGVYPRSHRVQKWKHVVPEALDLLPEHLRRHGVHTAAISANVFVSDEFGFEQGWDSFENMSKSERDTAEHVFGYAARWLREHGDEGPFLLYIQSMDAHTPYRVDRAYSKLYHPKSYDGPFGSYFSSEELAAIREDMTRASAADLAWIRALYQGEITYQDEYLGKLLATLEEMGRAEDTMVVVTNDHGEEMADHGGMGHTWTQYEEIVRAPLTIHFPPLFPAGLRVEEVVEHVDLAPTIVDALGLPPMPKAEGISMLPLVTGEGGRRRPLYATMDFRDEARAVRVGRWKLTVDEETGWKSLYDLEEDPDEKHDRKADRVLAARCAEIYLAEALAAPEKQARLRRTAPQIEYRHVQADIDDDTRQQMEALGYIDGDGE